MAKQLIRQYLNNRFDWNKDSLFFGDLKIWEFGDWLDLNYPVWLVER
jgi:hypothetical protein